VGFNRHVYSLYFEKEVLMKSPWFLIYSLVLALWVGGISIFTFIVTPTIFKSYGRDQAGEIVGKLLPGYSLYTLVLTILALALFFFVALDRTLPAYRPSLALLVTALAITLFVASWVHPTAVEVKRTVISFERESRDTPARKRFTQLHTLSMSLNLLLLVDGVVLLMIAPGLKK
jgi:Domain of unknown function (DUF4149)